MATHIFWECAGPDGRYSISKKICIELDQVYAVRDSIKLSHAMRIPINQSHWIYKTFWSLEWYSCVGNLVYRSSGTSGQPVVKFTWSFSTSDIWQQITIENSTTKSNNITINKIIYDECSIGELNNHPRSTDFFGS